MVFASAGVELAGTLIAPEAGTAFPAALVLAGSGPLDRDGNTKRLRLRVSRDLAALLAERGWGSLRFDKRGVGASEGDYSSTGMYEELGDADAAYAWLAAQPGVSGVVVVGHSVGATMAVELATRHPEMRGAVLLAFTAKTGEETLTWQTEQVKEFLLPAPAKALLRLFRTDLVKQQRKAVAKLKQTEGDVARVQAAKVNAKWMREFIAYDPLPALRRVAVPLLVITGSKDVQVDPDDLATVAAILSSAQTHVVDDVDHILRHEPGEVSNPRLYRKQVAKPIDPRVISLLSDWLASQA